MSQTATEPQNNTSRKVKALLAGGLVLGVGAAVTLAAWTDQEWAEGIFGTGSFNIQSSINGTDFADHESEGGAATLGFSLSDTDGRVEMAPGDTVAAPFVLRLDADSTYDATVTLEDTAAEAVNAGLSYGITQVESEEACTTAATGTEIVPAGTSIGATAGTPSFQLTAGADESAGDPVFLCFQVAAAEDGETVELEQGVETTAHWQFVGESVENAAE